MRKRATTAVLTLFFILAGFSGAAHADLIRLKNGKIMEGTVTEEDPASVSFEMGKAFMKIDRKRVDWVIRGKKEFIERKAAAGNAYLEGAESLRAGEYEQAIPLLEKALAMEPTNAGLQANLAYACAQAGKIERAILLYNQALGGDPTNRQLHMNLVSAYAQAGKFKSAATVLHRMLDEFTPDRQLYEKLSVVFHKAGLYTQSVLYAKKAAKLPASA